MLLMKFIGTCCFLKLATRCVGYGALGKDSGADQCKMLPVNGLLATFLESQANHRFWLPLLGLAVHRKEQAAYQGTGWLLLALGSGAGLQKS